MLTQASRVKPSEKLGAPTGEREGGQLDPVAAAAEEAARLIGIGQEEGPAPHSAFMPRTSASLRVRGVKGSQAVGFIEAIVGDQRRVIQRQAAVWRRPRSRPAQARRHRRTSARRPLNSGLAAALAQVGLATSDAGGGVKSGPCGPLVWLALATPFT